MSAAKHTPGPWAYVDHEYGHDAIYGSDGRLIAHVFGDDAQAQEDARLMAASTELLEAAQMGHADSCGLVAGDLLAAANVLRNHGYDDLAARLEEKHEAERKAIAKATGVQQ